MALCVAIDLTHHRVDFFNRGPLERLSLAALRCRRQDLEPSFYLGRLNAAGETFSPARKNEAVQIVFISIGGLILCSTRLLQVRRSGCCFRAGLMVEVRHLKYSLSPLQLPQGV